MTGADVLPLANLDFVQLRCFNDSVVLRSSDSEDREQESAAFPTASQQASQQKLRRPAFFFASDIRGAHSLCCVHSIRFMSLHTMSVCSASYSSVDVVKVATDRRNEFPGSSCDGCSPYEAGYV
jgi:hypothetical protein